MFHDMQKYLRGLESTFLQYLMFLTTCDDSVINLDVVSKIHQKSNFSLFGLSKRENQPKSHFCWCKIFSSLIIKLHHPWYLELCWILGEHIFMIFSNFWLNLNVLWHIQRDIKNHEIFDFGSKYDFFYGCRYGPKSIHINKKHV